MGISMYAAHILNVVKGEYMTNYSKINYMRTRPLSNVDLLKIDEVAGLLGRSKSVVKSWLLENDLILDALGRPRAVWGEVLRTLSEGKGTLKNIQIAKLDIAEDL